MLTVVMFRQKQDNYSYNSYSQGSSIKKRLLIMAGGLGALALVFGIVFSLLSSGGEKVAQQTLKLAQQHTEIIRVADMGATKATAQDTRNTATTIKLVFQSYQSQLTAVASKTQKVSGSQLSAGKNAKTDTSLETAKQNNRFDEAFLETIYSQLRSYQQALKSVVPLLDSSKDKQTLNELHEQISKLLPAANN